MTRAIAAIAVALMLVGAVAPTAHAGSLISFSSCGDEFHGRNCVPETPARAITTRASCRERCSSFRKVNELDALSNGGKYDLVLSNKGTRRERSGITGNHHARPQDRTRLPKPAVRKPAKRTAAPGEVASTTLPEAMTGRASPAKAADGDKPVFAYIASLPQPQRDIAERVDALAAKTLPSLQRSVKWGMSYYGVGDGWCFCCGGFAGHVKLMVP